MKLETIVHNAKKHLSDATAVNIVNTPVYALMETTQAGMSIEQSQDARILGVLIGYGGLGSVISKGRELSKKKFGVTGAASQKVRNVHDILYLGAAALVITPPFYLAAGARDPFEILYGTLWAAGIGAATGIPMGHALDGYKELTGVEQSKYTPTYIKNLSEGVKKTIAAGLIVGSLGLTYFIYDSVHNTQSTSAQKTEVSTPHTQ